MTHIWLWPFWVKIPLGCDSIFSISHPLFPTLYSKKVWLYSMTKRTASAAFPMPPPTESVPTALSVYVALSPVQFHQLETDQPIIPDPFSRIVSRLLSAPIILQIGPLHKKPKKMQNPFTRSSLSDASSLLHLWDI